MLLVSLEILNNSPYKLKQRLQPPHSWFWAAKTGISKETCLWITAVLRQSNRTICEVERKKRKRRSGKEKYEGVIMVGLKKKGKNRILGVGIVKICWWKKKKNTWFRNINSLKICWRMLEDRGKPVVLKHWRQNKKLHHKSTSEDCLKA